MGGITGFWYRNGTATSETDLQHTLMSMLYAMYGQNPEHCETWNDKDVYFGFRQSNYLNPADSEKRPMEILGKSAIVFDGEIYNYKELRENLRRNFKVEFHSNLQTEVVLRAYECMGEECLKHFNGMFAFAIWNPDRKELFLARDRVGVKPLYLQISNDIILFASRPVCLLQHPYGSRKINTRARSFYFETGFIPAPLSIWEGIEKVVPGSWIKIYPDKIKKKQYWDLTELFPDSSLKDCSLENLTDHLEEIVKDAVKLRCNTDVPLGAFLSGGIDSSLVCSVMQKKSLCPVNTYSIGFTDPSRDESIHAKKVAEYLGCHHHNYVMSETELLALLPEYFKIYDEPFSDYSALPSMMASKKAKEEIAVAIGGDGGDEFFGGYGFYRKLRSIESLFKLPLSLRKMLGSTLLKTRCKQFGYLGELIQEDDIIGAYSCIRSSRHVHGTSKEMSNLYKEVSSGWKLLSSIDQFSRFDSKFYMVDDVLQKVDIASVSYDLEVRAPLLDYRILEFALSLPLEFKLNKREGKLILKKLLSRYLPKDFYIRPKQGFTPPMSEWLRGKLRPSLEDMIHDSTVQDFCNLSRKSLEQIFVEHIENRKNNTDFLWAIYAYSCWEKEHVVLSVNKTCKEG